MDNTERVWDYEYRFIIMRSLMASIFHRLFTFLKSKEQPMNHLEKNIAVTIQGNRTTIHIKAEKRSSGMNIINTQGKILYVNNWKIQTTGKVESINQTNGDSVVVIAGDANPQISRK
jgi:hypothetical protein